MDELLLSPSQYQRLLGGVLMTLQILGFSFVLGVALSLVVGVARLSRRRVLRALSLGFVEFARGISSIVLLFIMAYAIPILLNIPQRNVIVLASIALGINMGGYGAEIIRGGILSVPRGQTEASIALNLTETQRLRHIVLPQAMRVILPPMGNLTIEILKGTALVSLVGLADLTFRARLLDRAGRQTVELLTNTLIMYFILAQIIAALYRLAERRVERRFHGHGGPAPGHEADAAVLAK